MSQEESLSRREKRAKRDAERHRIGKKRKQEDIEKVQDNNEKDFIPLASGSTEGAEDGSKKRKRPELEDTVEHAESAVSAPENAGAGAAPAPKSKKRRKNKSSNQAADGDAATNAAPNTVEGNPAEEPASKQRFIVFIGNLPYTATTESITKHFASISPTSVRHLTDPATGKSKGYAFLEFTNYDRMKTCLKLYHHTTFDSGAGGEKGQRKINVELTAGGVAKVEIGKKS
ncbi:hypothetical protein H2203_001462 [Taxawa tesnikishii (nom. ined.)]|nr:hypothetical protein H2203_001462 [Dothideales sp. JES 119]